MSKIPKAKVLRLLGINCNGIVSESFLDQGFKILSLNGVAFRSIIVHNGVLNVASFVSTGYYINSCGMGQALLGVPGYEIGLHWQEFLKQK